jgi:hypothetical protein
MTSTPQNCIIDNIEMTEQKISDKHLSELLYNVYNHVIFSTFPYTLYKESNSDRCIHKYNSGCCVALSQFVKDYLQANHNIKSYMIPASVPNSCKTAGTPHLTHCAILIPLSHHKFCIIDTALYFLEPMYCDLKENIQRTIKMSDVYQHDVRNVNYITSRCNECHLDTNYNQVLKKNSLCVSCYFENDESEQWKYYLNEIVNPDNNIVHAYLKYKKEPFLMYTEMVNNIPALKYKLKVQSDGTIVVKKYPEDEIVFNGHSGQFDQTKIKGEMRKYLSNDFSV